MNINPHFKQKGKHIMSLIKSIFPAANRAESANHNTTAGVRPRYDIVANDTSWTLKAFLPGVAKNDLSITDENGVLGIRGERAWKSPKEWTTLHRETGDEAFALSFQHEGRIDVEKIHAEFADGVLTVTLPKAEALKPRKIEIN
ncbi:HSP20 family protein [Ereboglobus sp. PH5-10]|nr:HSP20 family protein [Ereboglobus sp. PH5-10]